MNNQERILLKLYYPQFANPPNSRFESLFFNLVKKKPNTIISYTIYPELVIQGLDKRTTLVIKNIPNYIKKNEIRNLIEKFGNINFLHIVLDSNFSHLISAYLNVINFKTVASIYIGLRKHYFNYNGKIYDIKIFYSHIQGREQLRKIFKEDHHMVKSSINH